jgi:hypothetical protein
LGGRCSNHVRAESAKNKGRFADDEIITIRLVGLTSEPIILEP